jgi:tetratricopeptide (TPR) repeat protein
MPWILVAIIVLFAVAVRIRILQIPLERDEGEYAYTGQLMLQGIPPYKLAFSMKFPGIDAAYAAIMAVFGQTITGIHLGLILVNAGAIVLIYLLGKRLFTPTAGVAAAAAYALLSMGEGVFGAQAHATHFVVLAALCGTLLLLRAIDTRRWSTLLLGGVLYGIAVLMKQHGVLFVVFGVLYLAWDHWARRRDGWLPAVKDEAIFLCGVSLPLALTGLALWWAGVFGKFWFWTFMYAREYAQELTVSIGIKMFQLTFPGAVGPNLAIWLIALAGLVLVWWRKEERMVAVFASGFLVFSFLAICPGLYFREHYYILMLPAIALLAGAAVGTARIQWPDASWLTYGVYAAALVWSVVQQQEYLFQMSPLEITRAMYGANPFPEAVQIGNYIRTRLAKDSPIAVLGSEPEIPFYAQRRSVSGHIYMYGLVENQPYASIMQKELIRDVEAFQPDYMVFVACQTSWLRRRNSPSELFDWWDTYQRQHYQQVVGVADIISHDHTEYRWGDDAGSYKVQSGSAIVIYKRTDTPDSITTLLNHADALEAQGKLDDAAKEYRQALAMKPDNYVAHNELGIVLGKQGLTEEALKEFRLSLAIQPNQATAHSNMGWILTETHKFPEAVEELNQALRFDPADAHAHNGLGAALFQLGDHEKAVEQFNEAIRIDPAYAEAKRNLALAQAQMKNKKVDNGRK